MSLASFSEEATFVQRLLHFADDAMQRVFLALAQQVESCGDKLRALERQREQSRAASSAPKSRRKAGAPPMAASPFPSSDWFLLQHRLHCCLTLLENCLCHGAGSFERFREVTLPAAHDDQPGASAVQLLFSTLIDCLPALEQRQLRALEQPVNRDETASDLAASSSLSLLLPATDADPIAPLLCLLRIFCNATNHNQAGIASINQSYLLSEQSQVGHTRSTSVSGRRTLFLVLVRPLIPLCLCLFLFSLLPSRPRLACRSFFACWRRSAGLCSRRLRGRMRFLTS